MSNPFEDFAKRQMPAPVRKKHEAAEKRAARKVVKSEADAPMKLSDMEQKQADQERQLRMWRAWHRARVEQVANDYGDDWRDFVRKVKSATFEDHSIILQTVREARWLHEADLATRTVAVSLIANVIVRLREINGYAPFDDSLPGEDPTVFEIVRDELKVMT
jgi:hypothetical protein